MVVSNASCLWSRSSPVVLIINYALIDISCFSRTRLNACVCMSISSCDVCVKVGAKWVNGWGHVPYRQHLQHLQCSGPMFVINALLSGLTASEGGMRQRAPQQLADLLASISTGVKSISEEGQRPPSAH